MSDTDPRRILVPIDDSDAGRDTVSYAVDQAIAAAPDRAVELHFVTATRTRSVDPDAPDKLGAAHERLRRAALWVEEELADSTTAGRDDADAESAGDPELAGDAESAGGSEAVTDADGRTTHAVGDRLNRITVVTDVIGTDRYLFSPGDYADSLLEYAAAADIDRIVVGPEYNPAGTASMLQPMSAELARGDVTVETAPGKRSTEGTALTRATSLPMYSSLFVVSYLFYLSLSAWKPLDFFTGFVTASIVSAVLAPVVASRASPIGLTLRRFVRLLVYVPYLLKEIVVANFQVAYVVLHPDMPIDPQFVRLRAAVWGDGAVTMLGNSITLTPGTLTVTVSDRSFDVHSLTAGSRADLLDGGLERAVRFVFHGRSAARIPTPRERGDAGEGRNG